MDMNLSDKRRLALMQQTCDERLDAINTLTAQRDAFKEAAELMVSDAGPVDADHLEKGVIISLEGFDAIKAIAFPEEDAD